MDEYFFKGGLSMICRTQTNFKGGLLMKNSSRTILKEGTMRKGVFCSMMLFSFLLLSSLAFAKPNIEIKIKAEKETMVIKNGQKVKKMIPVKKVASGETIQYTITYTNTSKEPAVNAVVDDPIPAGTTYISGSASGDKAEITFSIDGGKIYQKPTLLTYEMTVNGKKEKKAASPEQYTNIRWTIPSIPAGSSGNVSFKALVK